MLALVLAAINLRPGITSFAPLIERIAEELALSRGLISLTTALPVLCMACWRPWRRVWPCVSAWSAPSPVASY